MRTTPGNCIGREAQQGFKIPDERGRLTLKQKYVRDGSIVAF